MIKKILISICCTLLIISIIFLGYWEYRKHFDNYTYVYIASHQISQRTKISGGDLLEIEVPNECITEDILIDKDEILGKYVKLSYSIPKGSFIYKTAVEDDIKDLANTLLMDGEINYDIYTKDVKINTANLSKNMYLDIYLTIDGKDKPISDLLLSDARITGLYDNNNKQIMDYDDLSKVAIVSIAISENDIIALNKALIVGELNCVTNNDVYKVNLRSTLNKTSKLFEYLD